MAALLDRKRSIGCATVSESPNVLQWIRASEELTMYLDRQKGTSDDLPIC